MVMSYTALVADKSTPGSIRSWMNYAKIDVDGVLEDAQQMIYSRLRVREMRFSDLFPVKAGASSIDVPDDLLDHIGVRDITNGNDLDALDETLIKQMRTYTGTTLDSGDPSAFGIWDEAFQFDCTTTTPWVADIMWYGPQPLLSESNPTNFLTKRYGYLLRMAVMATAARHNHDFEVFAVEQKSLFIEIEEVTANDEMSRSTYTPVQI